MSLGPHATLMIWLAALAATGCAHQAEKQAAADGRALATIADRHTIAVSPLARTLETPLSGGAKDFDALEQAEAAAFARDYTAFGHGPLVVSEPASEAGARRAAALRALLEDYGVPRAAIVRASHAGGDKAPVLSSFTRYVAQAPKCAPLWEQNLAFAPGNQPWESFGCASQANLAAMIADARDLEAPRAETPADPFRRQTVLDKYRQGQTTHSTRSADEKVDVSGVIQ